MATLGGLRSAAQTAALLEELVAHWERHAYGLWVFRTNDDDCFVGRAGLRHVAVAGQPAVELAYALAAEFWGRGLATEMARAILTLAFDELGMPEVVGFTLPTNRASQRVLSKVGFRFERDIIHADLPHRLYRIARVADRREAQR